MAATQAATVGGLPFARCAHRPGTSAFSLRFELAVGMRTCQPPNVHVREIAVFLGIDSLDGEEHPGVAAVAEIALAHHGQCAEVDRISDAVVVRQ